MDEVSKSTWGGKTASHVYTMYIGKEILNDRKLTWEFAWSTYVDEERSHDKPKECVDRRKLVYLVIRLQQIILKY